MVPTKERAEKSFETLQGKFGYKNRMSAPKLTKVVVSVATGSLMKKDRNKNEFIAGRLAKITGQKNITSRCEEISGELQNPPR